MIVSETESFRYGHEIDARGAYFIVTNSNSVKLFPYLTSPVFFTSLDSLDGSVDHDMKEDQQDRFADLHIHTHFSDGTDSPQEVVKEAIDKGLCCISIADHDTLDGIQPAIEEAGKYDLEVIPGIEFSSEIHGKDIHILGYFIDYKNQKLIDQLIAFQNARVDRIKKMIGKLKEQGIDNIDAEVVCRLARSDAVGRPHLSAVLIEKGWVKDSWEAFSRYLGEDCPAYVSKFKQTPVEIIELIRQAGGVSVLAHPMVTNIDELIPELARAGLGGIEVYYPHVSLNVIQYYEGIARKNNLVVTGGSDSHGSAKDHTHVGKQKILYELVEELRERAGK